MYARKIKRMAAKIANRGQEIVLAAAAVVIMSTSANAALTWTGITLNTADVESAMGLIIVGLATLWGFRKIVKTMNRS